MSILSNLSPERVFYYFEKICSVPHGSGNMEAISRYCEGVARNLGLPVLRDRWNNIIIKKSASRGYENHEPVILQGHLDMVCEKEADCEIDFETDGLSLAVEKDWISAKGTTLGGDDGIAVAMILALLEDENAVHPPLEAVFTVNEETGMDGAEGIDPSLLQGRILLNIDSECEGILTVSCAGGARATLSLNLKEEPNDRPCQKIIFRGLTGGHSGVEIHKGRTNANILMGEFLHRLPDGARIVSLFGGTKDNAIPARAECTVASVTDLTIFAKEFAETHRTAADPKLTVEIKEVPTSHTCYDEESSKRIAEFLTSLPNGVQSMSKEIDGLVETSLNLGQLSAEKTTLSATFLVRSSVNREKEAVLENLNAVASRFGGSYRSDSHYPAWEYRADSRLRPTMIRVFENLYGHSPVVEAIHAGLECGFFCDKLPGLDAVSFGPDIREIHTPRERLSISSTERTYRYLLEILKEL